MRVLPDSPTTPPQKKSPLGGPERQSGSPGVTGSVSSPFPLYLVLMLHHFSPLPPPGSPSRMSSWRHADHQAFLIPLCSIIQLFILEEVGSQREIWKLQPDSAHFCKWNFIEAQLHSTVHISVAVPSYNGRLQKFWQRSLKCFLSSLTSLKYTWNFISVL